jgi:hypothetical protein
VIKGDSHRPKVGNVLYHLGRISRHSLILRIYMEYLCTLHQGFTPAAHLRIDSDWSETLPVCLIGGSC